MARVASAALAAIVLLALAGPSSAATITQKIYGDLADNGRLDGHYTRAQINRALHAPSLQGYERPARPVVPRPEIASSGPSRPTLTDRCRSAGSISRSSAGSAGRCSCSARASAASPASGPTAS